MIERSNHYHGEKMICHSGYEGYKSSNLGTYLGFTMIGLIN